MTVQDRKSFTKLTHSPLLRGLVLDGSEDTRFVTRFFLNSLQVVTEECSSGKDALRRLLLEPFDFVVVDQPIGDMSCDEFLQCLEDARLEPRPQVILVSSSPASFPASDAVAAVLQKPFTVGSLEDAIWTLFPE